MAYNNSNRRPTNNKHKSFDNRNRGYNKKNNGNFRKGGKPTNKKFNNKGNNFKAKRREEIADKIIFFKPVNAYDVMSDIMRLDGLVPTEDTEKAARGRIYKNIHIYKVYISVTNRFVSGWSYKQVGWMTFHREVKPGSKSNFTSVTMRFVPLADLHIEEDAMAEIEIGAYTVGKQLMSIFAKAVNFSIDAKYAEKYSWLIRKAGFKESKIQLSTVYGGTVDTSVEKCYSCYLGGMFVNIPKPSDNDLFVKNYVRGNIADSEAEIKDDTIIIKSRSTGAITAKVHKLNFKPGAGRKRTIVCELSGADETAIRKFVVNGVNYENKNHSTPFDPLNKIDIIIK